MVNEIAGSPEELQAEMKKSNWLLKHREDVYSQNGEDGVIHKILELLPETDKWCVEFGAYDGIAMSNTRNLIESHDYAAVLIEGDHKRFAKLKKNYADNDRVVCLNQFVGMKPATGLDKILDSVTNQNIPTNFDLLSIDIDGNDYHVWDAICEYEPKVICIEFNPTIPIGIEYVQAKDARISEGNSLTAMIGLGQSKGYELVSVVGVNGIFVKREYFPLFEIADNSESALRTDLSCVTQMFMTYDGRIHYQGNRRLLWHFIDLNDRIGQQIPWLFRRNPEYNGFFRKLLYAAYRRYRILRNRLGI